MEPIIENEIDLASQLLKSRLIAKTVTQLSFEMREIEKMFGSDYYEFGSAENMLKMYKVIEDKVIQLAEEIRAGRQ
jgi:hypothetical protein